MEKFTLTLDSTQLASFFDCPEQWNLAHNERLEKNDQNKKAMSMGSYGHSILEAYYKGVASGITNPMEKALELKPEPRLELTSEEIQIIKDKLLVYSYTYARGDFVPASPDSVELGFSYNLFEDEKRLFILEGKLDHYQHTPSLGSYNGMRSIMDHKFQMKKHDLYTKRLQFRNYALATESNLFIVNYISMTKKTDETTFRRVAIPFSALELQLWKKRLIEMFMKVEVAIKLNRGDYGEPRPFEHRWNSCENKYGYACQFADICECTNQFEIEQVKATKYHKIEQWKPW